MRLAAIGHFYGFSERELLAMDGVRVVFWSRAASQLTERWKQEAGKG